MKEKRMCQNNHKMFLDWENGIVYEKPCVSLATKFTVDSFGIFYLCDECYLDDCKRRMDSEKLTIQDEN